MARTSRLLGAAAGLVLLSGPVPATAASTLLSNPAPATAAPTLHLLKPTGSDAVGATSIYLNDTSRPDPWVPAIASRELMATIWYPTHQRGGIRAPYMSAAESRLYLDGRGFTDLPQDALSTVRTNAIANARPA